jgi:hypothetical protein
MLVIENLRSVWMLDEGAHQVRIGKPNWPSDADLQIVLVKPAAITVLVGHSIVDKDSDAAEGVFLGPSDIGPVDHVEFACQKRARKRPARLDGHDFDVWVVQFLRRFCRRVRDGGSCNWYSWRWDGSCSSKISKKVSN